MNKHNAYVSAVIMQVLALEATEEYNKFQHERKQALDNARRRATSTLRLHVQQKKDDKIQANIQNVKSTIDTGIMAQKVIQEAVRNC